MSWIFGRVIRMYSVWWVRKLGILEMELLVLCLYGGIRVESVWLGKMFGVLDRELLLV